MINKNNYPLIEDLNVFLTIIRKNSFSGAAKELGQSNAYVTKRINILEEILNTRLFYRNTRQIKLTHSGEYFQLQARNIIENMDNVLSHIYQNKNTLSGHIHICSSFGFGRRHLAQPLSLFAKHYPELTIDLTLTDHKLDLVNENIDLEIAVGNELNDRYFAKKLVDNRRILCAAPSYLEQHKIPENLTALKEHNCLFLKEKGASFGVWKLFDGQKEHVITVNGGLTTNNGEVILQWALTGHGIIYRSIWDAQEYIKRGELIHILPNYYEEASVWAVYPHKITESLKVKVLVDFLTEYFRDQKLP